MSAAFALRPNTLAVSSAVLKSHSLSKLNRLPRLEIDRSICAGPSIKYSLIRLNPEITPSTPPANTPKTKPKTHSILSKAELLALRWNLIRLSSRRFPE
jgi:hypothetical protein